MATCFLSRARRLSLRLPLVDLAMAAVVGMGIDWKYNAVNALLSPGGYNLDGTKASHLSIAVAAAALPFLLPRAWRHVAWCLVAVAFTTLALVDLLYVRYFDTVPPVRALLYGCQAVGVEHSLKSLLQPGDAWFGLDLVVIGLLWAFLGRRFRLTTPVRWERAVAAVVVLGALVRFGGILGDFDSAYPRLLGMSWSPRYIAASIGLFSYHAVDVWSTAASLAAGPVPDEQVAAIAGWLDRHDQAPPAPTRGIARGANLIVIQVEALQRFTLGQRVNGQEVTPNLNRFAARSAFFTNVYGQTGDGNTADAEFMTNTSLYPLDHGAAFVCYPGNRYASLAHRLAPVGYHSLVLHANVPTFWNRYLMYPALGFETFRSADDFQQDERVGLGLSDRSFYRQSLPVLEHLPRPFHATLITLSSHHPYDDVAHFGPFPVGDYEGTLLGNYLKSIHYTDRQLGRLFAALQNDGLLDSSVVVLYGDHPGLARSDFPALARLTGTAEQARLAWLSLQKVPLLIHLPHDALRGVHAEPAGQIDIMPTALSLLGVAPHATFGRDLFAPGPARVVLRDGSCVVDGTYYDAGEQRAYDLVTQRPLMVPATLVHDALADADTHLAFSNLIVHHDLMARLEKAWQARTPGQRATNGHQPARLARPLRQRT